MPFYIGEFSKPIDPLQVIHVEDPAQTETMVKGDIVETWDHIFEWDAHCSKASELNAWRSTGDSLCDEALRSMFLAASGSTGVDLLESLQSHAASTPGGHSYALLQEIYCSPPDDIAATPTEICEAQAFFSQHLVAIIQCLLYFSLAGGFASPRIMRVLQSVSYLVPPVKNPNGFQLRDVTPEMNERTYSRILETCQFVLDVMGCTVVSSDAADKSFQTPTANCLDPGSDGWSAAVRVRLLHGVARRRILERTQSTPDFYHVERDGFPINQEDMAATLGSFSVAPLWCLRRLYLLPVSAPTLSQVSSFIATWRHIGFYLGIDPAILRKHFASPHTAEKFLASAVLHLLTPDSYRPYSPRLSFPTMHILLASSNRPPYPRSFEYNRVLTRRLLGLSLSTHLGVTPGSAMTELRLILSLLIAQVPVIFSSVYPRRDWSRKRATLTQEAFVRVVRFQLGMRRTIFRPRNEGGEIGEDVLGMEAVKADPAGRNRFIREYRRVMLEMVIVIAGAALLLTAVSVWFCARF